jgi:hypothetical protein
MLPKDKVKAIVALCLVLILTTSFFVFGKDNSITKYTSAFCLVSWLVTIIIINRKYK